MFFGRFSESDPNDFFEILWESIRVPTGVFAVVDEPASVVAVNKFPTTFRKTVQKPWEMADLDPFFACG